MRFQIQHQMPPKKRHCSLDLIYVVFHYVLCISTIRYSKQHSIALRMKSTSNRLTPQMNSNELSNGNKWKKNRNSTFALKTDIERSILSFKWQCMLLSTLLFCVHSMAFAKISMENLNFLRKKNLLKINILYGMVSLNSSMKSYLSQ